jgi:hypothetical protein
VNRPTEDPDEADLILVVEMGEASFFVERVRAQPLFRCYRERCFLFDHGDLCFPILPGIYAGLRQSQFRINHVRTCFVGSFNSNPIRRELANFQPPDFLIRDTSADSAQMIYHGHPADRLNFWEEYANSIADAKFSLCPHGAQQPASLRVDEDRAGLRDPLE